MLRCQRSGNSQSGYLRQDAKYTGWEVQALQYRCTGGATAAHLAAVTGALDGLR
jgi:hypothetical protein